MAALEIFIEHAQNVHFSTFGLKFHIINVFGDNDGKISELGNYCLISGIFD